jgi:hypothetical protein
MRFIGIQKWKMEKKAKKENEKHERVKENLMKRETIYQKSMIKLERKIFEESKLSNSTVSHDSLLGTASYQSTILRLLFNKIPYYCRS